MILSAMLQVPHHYAHCTFDSATQSGPYANKTQFEHAESTAYSRALFATKALKKWAKLNIAGVEPGYGVIMPKNAWERRKAPHGTTKDIYTGGSDYRCMQTYIGQYDGFKWPDENGNEIVHNESVFPLRPVVGKQPPPGGSGGDTGFVFAHFLWDKIASSGNGLSSANGQAQYAMDPVTGFLATNENAVANEQLGTYLFDATEIIGGWWENGGASRWLEAGWAERALAYFKETSSPQLWIMVPPIAATGWNPQITQFVNRVLMVLGSRVSFVGHYLPADQQAFNVFDMLCDGQAIQAMRVTTTGQFYEAADGSVKPALTVNQFESYVIGSPEYADSHVIAMLNGDAILVADALS